MENGKSLMCAHQIVGSAAGRWKPERWRGLVVFAFARKGLSGLKFGTGDGTQAPLKGLRVLRRAHPLTFAMSCSLTGVRLSV